MNGRIRTPGFSQLRTLEKMRQLRESNLSSDGNTYSYEEEQTYKFKCKVLGIRAGTERKRAYAVAAVLPHVRRLLKSGRAVVVKQKPFTIRLQYEMPEITQDLWGHRSRTHQHR